MKKVLTFLLLGFVSAAVTAAGLVLFLEDNNTNNFHKQCLEASLSSPFYRVMEELAVDEELDFDKAFTEARKIKCESLFKHAKTLKKLKLSGLELRSIDFLKYYF